jgi:hypothetical protein
VRNINTRRAENVINLNLEAGIGTFSFQENILGLQSG